MNDVAATALMGAKRRLTRDESDDLQKFRDLARQAHELTHGKFRSSATGVLVGMGRPNYHVKRIMLTLAKMADKPDGEKSDA